MKAMAVWHFLMLYVMLDILLLLESANVKEELLLS